MRRVMIARCIAGRLGRLCARRVAQPFDLGFGIGETAGGERVHFEDAGGERHHVFGGIDQGAGFFDAAFEFGHGVAVFAELFLGLGADLARCVSVVFALRPSTISGFQSGIIFADRAEQLRRLSRVFPGRR